MLKVFLFTSCVVLLLLANDTMGGKIVFEETADEVASGSGEETPSEPPEPPRTCSEISCDITSEFCKIIEDEPKCVCNVGYALDNNGTCVQAKQFFGQFVFSADSARETTILGSKSLLSRIAYATKDEDENIKNLEALLDDAYGGTVGYIESVVTKVNSSDVSNVYDYNSLFGIDSTVTTESFTETFNATISNCTASCPSNSSDPDVCCQLDETATIAKVGEGSGSECNCELKSTICGYTDGFLKCNCLPGYLAEDYNSISCTRITCAGNDECNAPFGTCNTESDGGMGSCNCMALFNGSMCDDPWLFIFVVVMSFLVFTVLVVLLWYCMTSSSRKKKQAKKLKYDEDISMDSLQGLPGIIAPKVDKWKVPDSGLRAKVPSTIQRVNRAYEHERY